MKMSVQSPESEKGSRDRCRSLLKESQVNAITALVEVNKLIESDKRFRIPYKETDAYIGLAVQYLELARIKMRKRKLKRQDVDGQVEVQKREPPEAPLLAL